MPERPKQEGIVIPDEDIARQAISSIGGYAYQLYASADAWLSLNADDTLLIECAEDYAVVADNALKAVQVKRTAKPVTLRTPSILDAINSFWRFQLANPHLRVQTVYLTTSSIGREKNSNFPSKLPGLVLWREAISLRASLAPLRRYVAALPLADELRSWLDTASDDEFCDRLLSRIQWQCGAPTFHELEARVSERIQIRCEVFGILPSESGHAKDAILLELLRVAASSGDRALRRSRLSKIIERATTFSVPAASARAIMNSSAKSTPSAAGRHGLPHEGTDSTDLNQEYRPPLTLRQREGDDDRLFFFAAKDRVPFHGRNSELTSLDRWLDSDSKFSWTLVTGPGGGGKSRLALELCLRARAKTWHAGFLRGGSAASAPTQFARFRAPEPTLIVLDYAIETPETAGELVRTLIDLSDMGLLRHSTRVLLIERSGPDADWWSRFTGLRHGRLKSHEARLGPQATFLTLGALDEEALLAIFCHVAGHALERQEIIDGLRQIDPFSRPLFAALAADATRNGQAIGHLSQHTVLDGILQRERRRWKLFSRDEGDLKRHENAAALATMVGGLYIPQETEFLSPDPFPFSDTRFNTALMEVISSGTKLTTLIPPIEPDILGEWFVLQKLTLTVSIANGSLLTFSLGVRRQRFYSSCGQRHYRERP